MVLGGFLYWDWWGKAVQTSSSYPQPGFVLYVQEMAISDFVPRHTHVHTYTHTYTHTHIHTYTHTGDVTKYLICGFLNSHLDRRFDFYTLVITHAAAFSHSGSLAHVCAYSTARPVNIYSVLHFISNHKHAIETCAIQHPFINYRVVLCVVAT